MPAKPLSDELALEAVNAVREHGTKRDAASALGINYDTFRSRYKLAVKRGLDLDPGIRDAMEFTGVHTRAQVAGGWIVKPTGDGGRVSLRFNIPETNTEVSLQDMVSQAIADGMHPPKKFPPRPPISGENLLVIDVSDVHVGKLCVETETGYEYRRDIAVHRLTEGVRRILERTEGQGVSRILFVIGNDILHVDNHRGTTTAGTRQDTDGTIQQMFSAAFQGLKSAIDSAAAVAHVDLLFVPSNHDWVMGWSLGQAVAAWFANDPRVAATDYNMSERHRKYYRFGINLLLEEHGDGVKDDALYPLFVTEARQHLAECKHLYAYRHHYHHRIRKIAGLVSYQREKEHMGLTVTLSAGGNVEGDNLDITYVHSPSAPDGWHDRNGYLNRQGVDCFLHHPTDGRFGMFTEWF